MGAAPAGCSAAGRAARGGAGSGAKQRLVGRGDTCAPSLLGGVFFVFAPVYGLQGLSLGPSPAPLPVQRKVI
jgi:hypothetical protein